MFDGHQTEFGLISDRSCLIYVKIHGTKCTRIERVQLGIRSNLIRCPSAPRLLENEAPSVNNSFLLFTDIFFFEIAEVWMNLIFLLSE